MKSSERKFIINPLGECLRLKHGRMDEYLMGSVNLTEACQKHMTEETYQEWRNRWDRMKDEDEQEFARLESLEEVCVAKEFEEQALQNLTSEEYAVYKYVIPLQTKFTNDRFRIYGGLYVDGRTWVVLATEFRTLVEHLDFWRDLQEVVRREDYSLDVMEESEEIEHWWTNCDTPEEEEHFGPNHGKLVRQVEVSYSIPPMMADSDVRREIDRMTAATADLWNEAGVSVI